MSEEIDVQTLQEWLGRGKPVRIIDVRTADDHAQWSIPGSESVDVYEALKQNSPGALADLSYREGEPIVTVCNLGRASAKAADILASRGIPAYTLRGGMKAWSLAWNTASGSFGPVDITQVRRTGKGCLSYLIRSGRDAAVIDASVDPDVYVSIAKHSGANIRYVLDTHIHADHLSRSRSLADACGAQLILPRQSGARFPHTAGADGDRLILGETSIDILATPGHTDESVTYMVPDAGIFTGDTLFLVGVGRPDIAADGPETEARARQLYRSLHRLISLNAKLMVFPGHTAEPVPFDGNILTASVGEISNRLSDWLASEDGFVSRIVTRIPPALPNYGRIVESNQTGEWQAIDPSELEAGANRCAVR